MPPISSKKTLALALVISTSLSGCATPLGTKLSTPFGYVNDHPDPVKISDYETVKEWAYGVSDGYSSRGTMNRYSLYWGAAIAAGGVGALGGLAATGTTGHVSIILPLAATFIGSLFGYYQNEKLAQVYYSASDSINTLINKSEKRQNLIGKDRLISQLSLKIKNNLDSAKTDLAALAVSKNNIPQGAKLLVNPGQDTIPADQIAVLGKMVDATNAKIAEVQKKIELMTKQQNNLDQLFNDPPKSSDGIILVPLPKPSPSETPYEAYEAGCLNEDVEDIMHKVRVHLTLLDPQNVSDDLKKVNAPVSNSPSNTTPPAAIPPNSFDLSDLDPKKIVSACDIGL